MKKLGMAVAACVCALGAMANTYYVTPLGAGGKDGSDWANAFGSIQAAVDAAGTEASTVFLKYGDYSLETSVSIGASADLVFIGGCTGEGTARGTEATVLKPVEEVRTRFFSVAGTKAAPAAVAFDGLTMTGGSMPTGASRSGMAVYATYTALTLADCVFEGNGGQFLDNGNASYSRYGGAIYLEGGTLTATGTTFRGNYLQANSPGSGTSAYGGALYLKSATVALTNDVFEGNYLLIQHFWANGGAIDLETCPSVSIVGCAFTSNHVQWAESYPNDRVYGGTLYASGCASLEIEDCTFTGSWINSYHSPAGYAMTFGHGGTMYLTGGSQNVAIRRTTVVDCGYRAAAKSYDSGAITLASGNLALENVLVRGIKGSGIELRGGTLNAVNSMVIGASSFGIEQSGGTATLVNSIVRGCTIAAFSTVGGTVAATYCVLQNEMEGEGNMTSNPLFRDEAAGDFTVPWYSPLVDRGADVDGLVTDLAGNVRPQDGNCTGEPKYDIGCYEAPTYTVDLACATMFSKESGMEPLDVTVTATVAGTARHNLTYKWTLTRTFGSSITTTESTTDEPELVLPGLEAGSYAVSCEVRNGDGLTRTSIAVNSLEVKGDSLYVTPTGSGVKDGSSWSDALPGVAAAVARAGTTPTKLRLLAGDYELSEQITVAVGANLTVIGGHTGVGNERGAGASVVKPAEGVRTRLFNAEGTAASPITVAFDGVTLTGGSMPSGVSQYGMAIYAKNAVLTFAGCVLEGNGGEFSDNGNNGYSRFGGAVYLESGTFTATGTTFRRNYIKSNTPGSGTSAYGGALYLKSATVALTNDVFEGNYLLIQHFSANGGAIDLESCPSAAIVSCTFTSNHVQRAESYGNDRVYGGTLYASGCASLLVEDCAFTGSWINSYHDTLGTSMTFGHGGTMFLAGGSQNATIRRTVVQNCGYRAAAANYDSGAVTLAGGTLTMENVLIGHIHGNCFEMRGGTANVRRCTFAGAEESRGAQGYGMYQTAGSATVTECIVAGNAKGGYIANSVSPATFTYCCLQDTGLGLGNFREDPLFADATYFHVKSRAGRYDGGWFAGGAWVTDDETSPALDRGDPASAVGDEPQPNRHLANVGYDAGLSVATKTYLGEPAVPTALAVYLYPPELADGTATIRGESACADGGVAEVTVCWGATDGGDDLTAWQNHEAFPNIADWTLVERTIETDAGRTYVRLRTDDGSTTAWSATASFVPPRKPALADTSLSHVTRTSFIAHGTLTDNGDVDTQVYLRYWTNDESEAVTVLYDDGKPVAPGTVFEIPAIGLEPGVTYHYAIEAKNGSGTVGETLEVTTVTTDPITVYVTPEGAGVKDGSSWANAFGNLQDAIDVCFCADDLICLKSGDYLAAQTKDAMEYSHYVVSGAAGLTIRGGYAGEGDARSTVPTVLRRDKSAVPNPNRRILHATNSTLTFEDLTVADGSCNDTKMKYGHGLLLDTCVTTVRNCVFEKNGRSPGVGGTFYGGAIYAKSGSLAVEGCLFDGNWINHWGDNSSSIGGAIYASGVALTVTGSSFVRNWTANMYQETHGGAIYASGGTFLLENSTFMTNCVIKNAHSSSSEGYGGTLELNGVTAPVIRDCTFQGGYTAASFPRGNIYLAGGSQKVTIERCKFLETGKDNKRPQGGSAITAGGIYLESGSLDLKNCLLAGVGVNNAVDVKGGTFSAVNCTVVDVANVGIAQTAGTASVTNSIVWNCGGGATTGAVTLDHSETVKDPLLYPATHKRAYHLKHGSPCAGAGDASVWTAADTDLDGLPRIKNGKVDLGCYSFNAPGFLLMVK